MTNSLKLKTLLTVVMIIMVISVATIVSAVDNYSVGVSLTSNAKLKEGETINVSVNLTS